MLASVIGASGEQFNHKNLMWLCIVHVRNDYQDLTSATQNPIPKALNIVELS
jgi:hypothetical protein